MNLKKPNFNNLLIMILISKGQNTSIDGIMARHVVLRTVQLQRLSLFTMNHFNQIDTCLEYTEGHRSEVLIIAQQFAEKNTIISPNFLVWEFCGKTQFPHSFGRTAHFPK